MRLLILIISLWALAYAKPEMYKEKEDFQFSRSSSDEGSKSGYYGAQRGNMGGNFERAHNMDTLAQHQLSNLVRQTDVELGEGVNKRTGSVYTSGNSRGIYGSGNYDLSNLKGRSFDEGTSFSDTQSQSSFSSQNSGYSNSYSAANNARYTTDQLRALGLTSQYVQSANQQAGGQYGGASNYEYGNQGATNYRYYTHGGSQAQNMYDQSNSNVYSIRNNDESSSTKSRIVTTPQFRFYLRPGTRIAIPVSAQTYDASQNALVRDQSTVNTEAELLTNGGQRINVIKPTNNAKHYESAYSYHKEWEKHDTQPGTVTPTENPYPQNSELYEDSRLSQIVGNQFKSEVDSANTHTMNSATASKVNAGYNSAYSANTKSAAASRLQYQSQQQNTGSNVASNAHTFDMHNSGLSTNMNSLVEDINTRPKSYQSSYSYHKSWERHGDPYVIKPAGGDLNSLTSQRLVVPPVDQNLYYGKQFDQMCDLQCHLRKKRSYHTEHYTQMHPENFNSQSRDEWFSDLHQNLGQQTQNKWDNLENLGQETQNQWGNMDLGQQTQNKWDNLENLGQETQNQWGNMDLGQQTQNTWNNLETLNQKPQTESENLGQETEDTSNNLETLNQQPQSIIDEIGQQSQSQLDNVQDLGQQTQNLWNNLETLNQKPQTDCENLGQETQNAWNNLETLTQHLQNGNEETGQKNQSQLNKLEDLGQETQNTWNNLETLNQKPQTDSENLGQETQNTWNNLETLNQKPQTDSENLGQETQNTWNNLETLNEQPQNNFEDISQQSQSKSDNLQDLGQQTQNLWQNLDTLNQNTQNNIESLGQETQNTWNNLDSLNHHTQNGVEDLGQKSQSKLDNFHDLGQQTQNTWKNFDSLNQHPQNFIRDEDQQSQRSQLDNVENIGQEKQQKNEQFTPQLDSKDQQTFDTWNIIENQQSQPGNKDEQRLSQKDEHLDGENQSETKLDQSNLFQQPGYNIWNNINSFESQHNTESQTFQHYNQNQRTNERKPTSNTEKNLWDIIDKALSEYDKETDINHKKYLTYQDWEEKHNAHSNYYHSSHHSYQHHSFENKETLTEKRTVLPTESKTPSGIALIDPRDTIPTTEKIKITKKPYTLSLSENKSPTEIGRGDIGADEIPPTASVENDQNNDKKVDDAHNTLYSNKLYKTQDEIESLSLTHVNENQNNKKVNQEEPYASVIGLEQQLQSINTPTRKPKDNNYNNYKNIYDQTSPKLYTIPSYSKPEIHEREPTYEDLQKSEVQIPDNLEQQSLNQQWSDLEQQTSNMQDIKDFGQQVQEPISVNLQQQQQQNFDKGLDIGQENIQKHEFNDYQTKETLKEEKADNVNNLQSLPKKEEILEQPVEPTEKPGFWKSVWSKTVSAKDKVVSWFKN